MCRSSPPRPPAANRVLIVDDHPIFREGLRQVINAEVDLTVCGEAASASEAVEVATPAQPDIAIVDLTLDRSNGIELIRDLKHRWADLPVLVLSNHDEALYAERCLRAGAQGFVMKSRPPAELVEAVRQALRGRIHLSDEVTSRILAQLGRSAKSGDHDTIVLSDREIQVFELYGKGRSTRQIALLLGLSIKTVGSHRDRIKRKLRLPDSVNLVRAAVQWVESQNGL